MAVFKKADGKLQRNIRIGAAAVGLVALAVYALTMSTSLFPGESAHLLTQWAGLDTLSFPDHPLWGKLLKLVAGMGSAAALAARMNFLSLLCAAVSAMLVFRFAALFAYECTSGEQTSRHAGKTSMVAGVTAAATFVFSSAIWQSATHLEYRMFDVTFALLVFSLFLPIAARPRFTWPVLAVMAVATGFGMTESAIFFALLPVLLFAVVVFARKTSQNPFAAAAFVFLVALVAWLWTVFSTARAFAALPQAATQNLSSASDVTFRLIGNVMHELAQWFKRPGWLAVMALAVLPFVACMFAAVRGLKGERKWGQYLFHMGMTLFTVLAIATPLAPVELMKPLGIAPVASTTLVAFVAGYLAAYWYATFHLKRHVNESMKNQKVDLEEVFGQKAAPLAGGLLVLVIALSALVNAFTSIGERGRFADVVADEILSAMGERDWLVVNGLVDDHLRVRAAAAGKNVKLVCLQRDLDLPYQKELAAMAEKEGLKGASEDLGIVARNMGVQPFVQDWFKGDPKVSSRALVFGVPDIWYWAEYTPFPLGLAFAGEKDESDFDLSRAREDFLALWARLKPELLLEDSAKGSHELNKERDPVERLRLLLRRYVGMIGTDLGVALCDAKRDDEAFEIFDTVLREIDRDNIAALFNEFELARANNALALRNKSGIEKRMKAIVADTSRRYALHSLSVCYGYIRNPEIFVRMGYDWARSGMAGNAIPQFQRARNLLPESQQAAIFNMMAAIYASDDQTGKSRELY